jgi:UDP-N-acetylmuramate dehydrogenase
MHLDQKISLKRLNTFGLEAEARYFVEAKKREDIFTLLNYRHMIFLPVQVLGGGSNLLFNGDFPGLVIHINTRGIAVVSEDENTILITAQAGEPWDPFVEYTIRQGWSGLEQLSLIPGTVGAAPIQNIGAYGCEAKETIESVHYVDIKKGSHHTLSNSECQFGYRDSIFKGELKGRFMITEVTFRLKKIDHLPPVPVHQLHYKDLVHELLSQNITFPTPQEIRDAVVTIRRAKLPDPSILGNAGSFFKNPVIPMERAEGLKERFPQMPLYADTIPGMGKVSAAWLIDQCGWKGFRDGDAGVHDRQPLVLVNYGNATAEELLDLAGKIRQSVLEKFGIQLEMEVGVVG